MLGKNLTKSEKELILEEAIKDKKQEVVHSLSLLHSWRYVYRMLLGESELTGLDPFDRGFTASSAIILTIFYVCATSLVMLILLNVIIAVMGDS